MGGPEYRGNMGHVLGALRRMLLKRELRLVQYREHGALPDSVTPSWLLERTLTQIAGVFAGLDVSTVAQLGQSSSARGIVAGRTKIR